MAGNLAWYSGSPAEAEAGKRAASGYSSGAYCDVCTEYSCNQCCPDTYILLHPAAATSHCQPPAQLAQPCRGTCTSRCGTHAAAGKTAGVRRRRERTLPGRGVHPLPLAVPQRLHRCHELLEILKLGALHNTCAGAGCGAQQGRAKQGKQKTRQEPQSGRGMRCRQQAIS